MVVFILEWYLGSSSPLHPSLLQEVPPDNLHTPYSGGVPPPSLTSGNPRLVSRAGMYAENTMVRPVKLDRLYTLQKFPSISYKYANISTNERTSNYTDTKFLHLLNQGFTAKRIRRNWSLCYQVSSGATPSGMMIRGHSVPLRMQLYSI